MKRTVLALLLALLLTAGLVPAMAEEAPTPLSIISPEDGRIVKEDNPAWLALEEATNTDLTLLLMPGTELQQKLNTMAASNTLPDIIKYKEFYPYAEQGVMLDIGALVDEYGPNLKKHIPEHLWEFTKYKGVQVAIPYMNEAGKFVMAVRQDWLDKLALEAPKNLDELYDLAIAFATQDPDGNGEADTYAFGHWDDFMPIYGAYGIIGGGGSGQQRYYYVEDEQLMTTIISPEYKEVLTYINGLWNANAIDPDFMIMQNDQYRQKLATGKIGLMTQWWSLVPEVLPRLGFAELNPDASWSIVMPAPEGPGGPFGNNGMRSVGEFQQATWLSASTEHPEEAIKFLDFLISDEGYMLSYYGIQGEHYNTMEEGRTEAGQAAFDERWLDAFNQIVGRRTDIVQYARDISTDPALEQSNAYAEAGLAYNLYLDALFGLPNTQAELDYDADLNSFEIENRVAFITGQRSLDEYDQYVEEWLNRGGRDILEDRVAQYNEMKGASLTAGQLD